MDTNKLEGGEINSAVATLIGALPPSVQEFIVGPERDRISLALTQKYNLHADQAATFAHAYLYLLLGILSPEEFTKTLSDAGIDQKIISGLTNDVNELVFKPLREKVQQPPASPRSVTTPQPTQPLVPPMTLVPPVPELTLPPAPIQAPAPVIPPPPVVQAPVVPPPPVQNAPIYDEHPAMRTMATDMQAVKEHHDPMAAFSHAPVTPAPAAVPAPVVPPPLPPSPVTEAVPAPAPHAPPPPNLPGTPQSPLYRIDPYREPTE